MLFILLRGRIMDNNKDKYFIEIVQNIKKLKNLFKELKKNPNEISILKEIQNIVKLVIGSSRLNDFKTIFQLSEGLNEFLETIISNNIEINDKYIKIFYLTMHYYKWAIKQYENSEIVIGMSGLHDIYKNCSSVENIDINKVYINDILKNNTFVTNFQSLKSIDDERKVEVNLKKIDNIINKLNDIVLYQYQLKQEIERIKEIEYEFSHFVFSDDNNPYVNEAKNKILNNISKIKKIRSNLYGKIIEAERDTFTLQEQILSFRMLPIKIIIDDIKRNIDIIIANSNKKIEIEFSNKTPLIDKYILNRLKRPIENIIINSIEHGIETKEERLKKNKSAYGKILVDFSESAGKITITITDDGKGVDFTQLRKNCMELFPYESEEIEKLSEEELVKYLFIKGVTTVNTTNNNKGAGLYDAQSDIEQIKGKITLISKKDQGVTVSMSFPKSLTTVSGFFVTSCKEKFLIPSTFISEIVYIDKNDVIDLLTKYAIKLRNDIIPIYPLSGIIKPSLSTVQNKLQIIIVEEFGEKIGIIVDEILYHSSLIYKPMPKNIEKLKMLQGIVFDEEYKIVNILYIPEIIKRLKKIRNIEFREKFSNDNMMYKNILIVDDSEINREIEINIIKKITPLINVDHAENGIDALEKTKNKIYNLIITDSSMPKMDGVTFIENLRKEEKYSNVPVIAVISSDDPETGNNFKRIGVNDILNKSYFNREMFIETINRLLNSV